MEKFQALRAQISADIKENSKIWEQEQKIAAYRDQLMKVDKVYFEPVFAKLNGSLNLLNFENYVIKDNNEYLKVEDKLIVIKMLEQINYVLGEYNNSNIKPQSEILALSPNLEYQTLISTMHQKINEFQKNLASKMQNIETFTKNLEFKYKQYKLTTNNFDIKLQQLQKYEQDLQITLQKVIPRINYKSSLLIFASLLICLVLVVVLVLLILFIK